MEKYNILVPVDFSSRSTYALRNAIAIGKRVESHITILHAVKAPVIYDSFDHDTEVLEEIDEAVKESFNNLKNEVPELQTIDHEFRIDYALSPDAITTYNLQNKVDLIVMGTRGKSARGKAFLGSNTYAVINSVKCPVLALPDGGDISDAKKIILAVDYESLPSYSSFEPLIRLARIFGAQINIIHIGNEQNLNSDELQEARSLEQYFKNVKHQYKYLLSGNEEKTILDYLKKEKARILAIISKKQKMVEKLQHRSLTKKIIRDLKTPLLVLHETF